MSGTSLDGIDLVEVTFTRKERWQFQIKQAATYPYSADWQKKLQQAIHLDPPALQSLNTDYTDFLAEVIADFIRTHKIHQIDAVCSHGHTVFHQPEKGITLQIGNTPRLAQQLGHTVVCDFRTQDVALGGQGAPLVPVGDRLLFGEYGYCLNIGGFANISFEDEAGNRIAYDICPANNILNYYAGKLGKPYDHGGKEASKGKLHGELLHELDQLEFYTVPPPKSLGIEWVEAQMLPIIQKYKLNPNDILRTLTGHITLQIAAALKKDTRVLVTGGGACNDFLIQNLRKSSPSEIVIPEKTLIDYKEALVFALLGILKIRGEINCLSSATGARHDHSSGKIFKS